MLITATISAVIFYAVWRAWSSDRCALRQTQAALGAVQQERDQAIVQRNAAIENGKTAYAQGNADGRQLERAQIERERVIATRKRQIQVGDARARLN